MFFKVDKKVNKKKIRINFIGYPYKKQRVINIKE